MSNGQFEQVVGWLRQVVAREASDLFVTAGFPPALKLNGKIVPLNDTPLTSKDTHALARALMNEKQWGTFAEHKEANFALLVPNLGRFRISVFLQQGYIGLVGRRINTRIPNFDELQLPKSMREVALSVRGLVLLVGGTGTGKSTSLAAMIGYRNQQRQDHILTVEDPIEFVHQHQQSIITQREVGSDTESWEAALKNSLRQAPDVILIGEIRDRKMMEFALQYAETGHLCLSTLHANNASQALERILGFFPLERRDQLLLDLSMNLQAVISQRLVPRQDGAGRVAAVEIMLTSPLVSDLIQQGRIDEIRDIMARSRDLGMQTFDQALFDLYDYGIITAEDALRNADSYNNLRIRIKQRLEERQMADGDAVLAAGGDLGNGLKIV